MKRWSWKVLRLVYGALLGMAFTQTPSMAAKPPGVDSETLRSLAAQRDSFVQRARESGVACPLPPPRIILTDKSSHGSYDPKNNLLQTPSWRELKPGERELFYQLAGPGAAENQVREAFENVIHRWALARDLGHWWQSCNRNNVVRSHFEFEYDADRIAAAYWREVDPALMDKLADGFRRVLKGMPIQLPVGETPERYFNEHFGETTRTASYTWFEAFMIASVEAEDPLPSFSDALADGRAPVEPTPPPPN
jgi:hypothetical protein